MRHPVLDDIPILEYAPNKVGTNDYLIKLKDGLYDKYCIYCHEIGISLNMYCVNYQIDPTHGNAIYFNDGYLYEKCLGYHYKNSLNDEAREVIRPYIHILLDLIGNKHA